jgi:hypothetical protein
MLKMRTEKLGYHYQYTRNMLQLNNAGNNLLKPHYSAESRQQIGVDSFADYNQDGEQDLFVCNGIPKRPNDLDYVKYYKRPD